MLIATEVSTATGNRTRISRSRSVYAAAEYTAIHSGATNSGQYPKSAPVATAADTIVATASGARRRQASDAPATTASANPSIAGGSSGRCSRSANPTTPTTIMPSARSASQIRGSTRRRRSHHPPSTNRTVSGAARTVVILQKDACVDDATHA